MHSVFDRLDSSRVRSLGALSFLFTLTMVVLATTPAAVAQTLRSVPAAYLDLEGTSASRSPLGWPTSRIQYLIDSSEICTVAAGLTNLRLRLDGGNFNIDAPAPQSLQVTIEAYEVSLTPRTMSSTWANNIAGATPTTVFSGNLNVPAASRTYPWPNPWVVDVPLNQPFTHVRANGNLLLDWNVAGGTGDNWPADAVFLRGDEARGETTRIWEDTLCVNARGDALSLSIPSATGNGAIGLALQVDHNASPAPGGALDVVIHHLGLSKTSYAGTPLPIDLTPIGLPTCQWNTDILATQNVIGASSSALWPIPRNNALVGATVFTQAIGVDSTTLQFVPSSSAWQCRIVADVPPMNGPLQMVHRGNYTNETTGFLSPTGYYGLVMGFVGFFQ